MGELAGVNSASCSAQRNEGWGGGSEPKQKVFLSHSGAQKAFVEHLCVELEGCFRFPFFDKRRDSLPIGEQFPKHIFDAIQQCHVGVVILSEEFFTSKWPMMELAAMVEEVKKGSKLKIVPVFFGTSLKEFDDPVNRGRWQSCWHELASKNKNRVVVEKWDASLKYLRSINGLVYDGRDEFGFQKVVVDAICEIVPPEIKMGDSHIQGRSRICKEIRNKMDVVQEDTISVMGLYGMGGMGKTSICKALCNEFYTQFRGRVCHAELERVSEEELLRRVVKKLSNTSHERLKEFNEDELRNGLKEGMIKDAVFLAVDNMSDSDASIMEARRYLSARLPRGSVVMVTARSKGCLTRLRPYLSDKNCMEMPELKTEEAKSLFAESSGFELEHEGGEELMQRCVKRCWFKKDDDDESYHYHPLALDVLGRQLGYIDPREWNAQLDKIDEDIFNQSKENSHPVFSILRKSYDMLSGEDQLLFMDIALFLPEGDGSCVLGHDEVIARQFEWLGLVHGIPGIEDVMIALERLKRKSVLERAGDGKTTRIGMHDLWRAFCVAETGSGKLKRRRWVYEECRVCESDEARNPWRSGLVESSPCGSRWENVQRMAFLGSESRSLERVNFAHFSNVTALKISRVRVEEELVVDLSGLIHLKSLEMSSYNIRKVVVRGLAKGLIFLSFVRPGYDNENLARSDSQGFVKQIECLKGLQYLELSGYAGGELPDVGCMVSVRVAIFRDCRHVVALTGLGSRLRNLRVLDLARCWKLRSCPGVGDLQNLEELRCWGCSKLEGLPNLRLLKKLRKLDVSSCRLITELPGLDDLVALEELRAYRCSGLSKLPGMHKLSRLRVLILPGRWFGGCGLEVVRGCDSLISLEVLSADFRKVVDKPSLWQLTKLQTLRITGWSAAGLRDLPNLVMLRRLWIGCCSGVDKLPDLRSLIRLLSLSIYECEFKDVSGLSNLSALYGLFIYGCEKLERLSGLQGLTGLESLIIRRCPMVRGWDICTLGQVAESSCMSDDSSDRFNFSDSQKVAKLRILALEDCGLADLACIGAFSQLEELEIVSLPVLRELPDLSMFPQLKVLELRDCGSLRRLRCCERMNGLSHFTLLDCRSMTTLPDLCNFPGLLELRFVKCHGITSLSSSGALGALRRFEIVDCSGLKELPDLGMFPALEVITVKKLSKVTVLSSSVPLTALREIHVQRCRGLSRDDVDQLRALSAPRCALEYVPSEQVEQLTSESIGLRVSALHEDVKQSSWLSRRLGCFWQ